MIRLRWIAALALVVLCSVKPALADDWTDCADSDPDRSISACTRVIGADGGWDNPRNLPTMLRMGDSGQEIDFDKAEQIADMVDAVGGALPGELVVLAQEGRQLERLEVMGEQKLGRVGHHATPLSRPM